ncbi:MAG: DUF1311 domain-containing protein [Deltaproteobacteria bacterium]|nr:DUF1311 domain-containing protein [Deltaproteobacteria bacterium]
MQRSGKITIALMGWAWLCGLAVLMGGQARAAGFDDYHRDLLNSSAEYRRLDQELNVVYRELMNRLDPGGQARVQQSQREWLKKRKTTVEMLLANGQDAAAILISLTANRLADLRRVLEETGTRESTQPNYSGVYRLQDKSGYCGGQMKVRQQGDRIHVAITTVCGRSAHICEFDGQGTLSRDAAFLTDKNAPDCKIAIKFSRRRAEVIHEPLSSCCGANATMQGTYILQR